MSAPYTKIQLIQLCAMECGYVVHGRLPDDSLAVSPMCQPDGEVVLFKDPYFNDARCFEIVKAAPEFAATLIQAWSAIRNKGGENLSLNQLLVENIGYVVAMKLAQHKRSWQPL